MFTMKLKFREFENFGRTMCRPPTQLMFILFNNYILG